MAKRIVSLDRGDEMSTNTKRNAIERLAAEIAGYIIGKPGRVSAVEIAEVEEGNWYVEVKHPTKGLYEVSVIVKEITDD